MQVLAKNVYYKATDSFNIHIPYLDGRLVSFLPDERIIPEQTSSFELRINAGKLQFNRAGMETYLRETIFRHVPRQIARDRVTFAEPNQIILAGDYHRRFPFRVAFETHLGDDNTIYGKVKDMHVYGLPLQGLVKRLKISLAGLLAINDINPAISLTETQLLIDPKVFVPGLKLDGPLTSFHISEEDFTITYGQEGLPPEYDLDCGPGGFVRLLGGLLQVRPFTISQPDVLIRSGDYPFAFACEDYPYIMACGRSTVHLDQSIHIDLKRREDCRNQQEKQMLNTILPLHLQFED